MLKKCKTAIILAGGKSSRMGFDKINIPYKDGRLLDYQINILKELFKEIIVVSNNLTSYNDESVKIVSDEYHQIGPIAGLHVGLKHTTSSYSYVIACDMPFINLGFIAFMDELLTHFNKDVLLSEVNGYLEPFNAVYHKTVFEEIEGFVENSSIYGLKDLIKKLNYQVIDRQIINSYDKKMFYNLNTIKDIENYLKVDVIING